MTVTVPEGTSGDVTVRRFQVSAAQAKMEFLQQARYRRGCRMQPGTFTGLYRHGMLLMSDTHDERRDHYPAVLAAIQHRAQRVLINGLGLGMVVAGLLTLDHVTHLDVVEIDSDVIALVEGHCQKMAADAGKTLTVHHGDAYTIAWPTGTRWDVAWHDIWHELNTDNLPKMATIHRRYGRRVTWQGSWCQELLRHQRVQEERRFGPASRW